MQFRTLIVSFFAAVAVAQTPTSGSSAPSGTSGSSGNLVSTVNDLPRCALGCLKTAAEAINCNPANFKCLCSNTQALLGSVGPCALSACNSGDVGSMLSTSPWDGVYTCTMLTRNSFLRAHRRSSQGLPADQRQPSPSSGCLCFKHCSLGHCYAGQQPWWPIVNTRSGCRAEEDGCSCLCSHGWCRSRVGRLRHVNNYIVH